MSRCANGHSVIVTSCSACWEERSRSLSAGGGNRSPEPESIVDPKLVTTLDRSPGYRTITALAVVSELSATSGWTASAKGGAALGNAMWELRRTAVSMGANAIVGVIASSFGARGGITSMLGGDAVGVLLMGTAVTAALETEAESRA